MNSSPASPTPWEHLPPDLAATMRPDLERSVREVAAAVTRTTPAFAQADNPKFERDVQAGVRTALERFLGLIGTREPALTPDVRDVFVSLGAAEAREHRGPGALLAAQRTASRLMLRTAAQSLAMVRPVSADDLVDLADAMTTFAAEITAASTDGYSLQLREEAGEGDRRRRHLSETLLRGGAPESAAHAAAVAIGWPALGTVVPVLLPLDQARDARFRYVADGVVFEREEDCVLLLCAGPRTARSQLTGAFRGCDAVIGPALGWARVPAAVRMAELTATLPRPGRGEDPLFAEDHLVALALQGEPDALGVLSVRRLEPLAGLRTAQRQHLLDTLRSWLMNWGSRADVAAELFVHPQTVSYRLKKLRELLGDDLDDPIARFELLLILTSLP